MYIKRHTVTVVLIAFWLLANLQNSFGAADSISKAQPNGTNRVITEFSVTNASVMDVVVKLWSYGIRVCYECKNQSSNSSVTMHLYSTSCREILQNLAVQDPEYKYDIDASTGIVNIYPKTGSVLDYKITYYKIRNITLDDAVDDKDNQLKFSSHRVGRFSMGFEPDDLRLTVSMTMKDMTARACLNALMAKGTSIKWEIQTSKNGFNALQVNPLPPQPWNQ